MSTSNLTTAKAGTSCRRCNRRKKKCDRALPECLMCCNAHVACSFLNNDRQVGSYPVMYVQNLEARVKELEKLLIDASHQPLSDHEPIDLPDFLDDFLDIEPDLDFPTSEQHLSNDTATLGNSATTTAAEAVVTLCATNSTQPDALVDGLRTLSLEATAERYLGSSSGLSFAKLTQAVLRRLSPDKADFVFSRDQDNEPGPQHGLNDTFSPGMFLDPAAILETNHLPQYTLSLFGGIPLSQFMEEESVLAELPLPDKSHISHLTDFYFAHSHTLYPIIRRDEFMSALWTVYEDPESEFGNSPIHQFRIWMVLAVGSTSYHTISLIEESESVLYYNKAMSFFEAALGTGDIAALEVLMLQVSYSFFNQIGPNTWFLVGVAARIAIGIGLHSSITYENLPLDVTEYRKRLFFSLYMMDRVVSAALGRPFAIHHYDVDVTPFSSADEDKIQADVIIPSDDLQPSIMAVPLHILALRNIAGEIANNVYSKNMASQLQPGDHEEILETIHKKLISWRREMPFPLPDVNPRVPHLCSTWYDFNYYTHVARLYRPSPLCPLLDERRLKILTTASSMSIRQAMNLHRQQRFAYNWLNLLEIFASTMSLIYSITVQPEDLATIIKGSKVIEDLELAIELLSTFAKKFAVATKIKKMVLEIQHNFKTHRET